jgi:hypothetical protein
MQTQDIDYRDDTMTMRGYLAFDDALTGRRPGVVLFHEGLGLGDFAMTRARMLGISAMSHSPPTCSATAGRRTRCKRRPL